ncbi:hypothetical protein BJ912DRAFT_924495 [Pholiota molesta]|nr:hypothetical protein BJ912DRAFT_924495 [Pholiota molesta]
MSRGQFKSEIEWARLRGWSEMNAWRNAVFISQLRVHMLPSAFCLLLLLRRPGSPDPDDLPSHLCHASQRASGLQTAAAATPAPHADEHPAPTHRGIQYPTARIIPTRNQLGRAIILTVITTSKEITTGEHAHCSYSRIEDRTSEGIRQCAWRKEALKRPRQAKGYVLPTPVIGCRPDHKQVASRRRQEALVPCVEHKVGA